MAESEPVEEPSSEPDAGNQSGPAVRRTAMRQRLALWAAAAVVVLTAGALVAVAAREDDSAPPALPLAVATAQAESDTASGAGGAAEPMAVGGGVRYVPAEDLAVMGGEGAAYRLSGSTDEEDVHRLANAFGIDGDPTERDGFWQVDDNQLSLSVYGPEGTWSVYRNGADDVAADSASASGSAGAGAGSAGSAGSSGSAGSDPATVVDQCEIEPPPSMSSEDVTVAVECAEVLSADPREPVRPTEAAERPDDLPDEAEARDIALELLTATGAEVDGAAVRVEDGITQWIVVAEPTLGGLRAPGLSTSVAVGREGRIEYASGHLGQPEELGQYPLLDTGAALERLNQGWTVTGAERLPLPVGDPETPVSGGIEPAPAVEADSGSDSAVSDATGGPGPSTTIAGPPHDLPPPPPAGGEAPGGAPTTIVVVPPHDPTPPPAAGTGVEGGTGPASIEPPGDGPPSVASEPAAGQVAPPGTAPPQAVPRGTTPQAPPETPPQPSETPATTVPAIEILVTEAEMVYVLVPSWDGSGVYLVPGYEFVAEDGSNPVVPAISDHVLERPPDGEPPNEGPAEPSDD